MECLSFKSAGNYGRRKIPARKDLASIGERISGREFTNLREIKTLCEILQQPDFRTSNLVRVELPLN